MRPHLICRLVLSAILCVLPLAAVQAEPSGMTLEDISRLVNVQSATLSPDGQHVAFIRSLPRTPYDDEDGPAWAELHLMTIGSEPRPFVTGEVNVSQVSFSADGRTLYYRAKRGNDEHQSLYRIAVDGGESQPLLQADTAVAAYSVRPDGKQLAYLAMPKKPDHVESLATKGFKAKVYEEDIQSQQLWLKSLEDEDAEATALAIDGHVTSVQYSPDGSALLIQSAPTSLIDDAYMALTLSIVDLEGRQLTRYETQGKQGKAIWSDDSSQVAFIGANDFNDPSAGAVYVGDRSGGLNKAIPNPDSQIRDIAWQDGRLYSIEHQGLESRVTSRKPGSDRVTVLDDYGDGIHSSLSVSPTGRVVSILNHASHPNELYALNGRHAGRLTTSNPWLDDRSLGRQVAYEYPAEDGLSIQGVLVYPVDYQEGQQYPLILFIHGGPEAHRSNGWNTTYAQTIQVAAAEGYVSLIPNYRGSTGRGHEFSTLGQHAYTDPEFTDILDGKRALVAAGLVDGDRVGVTGGSYGGYATAWSATALSEHYAAGVMFVGISNQLSKFGTTDIPVEMHAVHSRAWPWDDYQWMLETSPIYHVTKARTPLLIMHGDSDTRVHPSQSMELYRYLKVLGQAPVRLVLYPGEGHGNRKAAAQLDYSMRLMRWMDHYLKGEGGTPPAYDLKHEEALESDEDTEEDSGNQAESAD